MIKRYDLWMFYDEWQEDVTDGGAWVKYDDHAAELATLREQVGRLREALAKIGKTYAADNGRLIHSQQQIATIAKEALK